MKYLAVLSSLGAAALASACASHGGRGPETDPRALAAVRAELRMVGSETTWVARGQRYELVGRTKADIIAVQSPLDGEIAALKRVFPDDTLAFLVVTVRRMSAEGQPYTTTAPLPNTIRGTVVDVVLPTPKAIADQQKTRGNLPGIRSPTLPAVRAWLSSHASEVMQTPARPSEADGEFEDPRVPAWAQEMIPSLASDSLLDRVTKLVAARPDNLIPVATYFTMQRAPMGNPLAERGAEGARGAGGGGTNGRGGGGMGGSRGGMGGGRGGMGGGRGGMGGGTASRSRDDEGDAGLRGSALFEAQSMVFGRYLIARDGPALIAEIMDAQMLSRPIDEALARRKTVTLKQMDLDWLQWLLDRNATLSR